MHGRRRRIVTPTFLHAFIVLISFDVGKLFHRRLKTTSTIYFVAESNEPSDI